jgi:hypothetical protein
MEGVRPEQEWEEDEWVDQFESPYQPWLSWLL